MSTYSYIILFLCIKSANTDSVLWSHLEVVNCCKPCEVLKWSWGLDFFYGLSFVLDKQIRQQFFPVSRLCICLRLLALQSFFTGSLKACGMIRCKKITSPIQIKQFLVLEHNRNRCRHLRVSWSSSSMGTKVISFRLIEKRLIGFGKWCILCNSPQRKM